MRRLAIRGSISLSGFALVVWLGLPGSADSQTLGCRLTDATSGPPRQVLRCDAGPVVEAEAGADVHVVDRAGTGRPDGARITTGAALIEVPPDYPGGFRVLTPRAIASVRGTRWAVEAKPDSTSVLVLVGRVEVARPDASSRVTLGPGEGVDVDAGAEPLVVKRWGKPRVDALLARFGR